MVLVQRMNPFDNLIVCGRGQRTYNNSGNKTLRKLVARYLPIYMNTATSRTSKSKLVDRTTHEILNRGMKFVKPDPTTWTELSYKQARNKVGHRFRDAARRVHSGEDELEAVVPQLHVKKNNQEGAAPQLVVSINKKEEGAATSLGKCSSAVRTKSTRKKKKTAADRAGPNSDKAMESTGQDPNDGVQPQPSHSLSNANIPQERIAESGSAVGKLDTTPDAMYSNCSTAGNPWSLSNLAMSAHNSCDSPSGGEEDRGIEEFLEELDCSLKNFPNPIELLEAESVDDDFWLEGIEMTNISQEHSVESNPQEGLPAVAV